MLTEHTILFEQEPNQTKPNQWNKQTNAIEFRFEQNKPNQRTSDAIDAILNFEINFDFAPFF